MITLWLGCASPAQNPLQTLERLAADPVDGEVVEVVTAGEYAYLRLRPANDADLWVAGFDKGLVVGDRAHVRRFGRAENYRSARTDRTFDTVWFSVVSPVPR